MSTDSDDTTRQQSGPFLNRTIYRNLVVAVLTAMLIAIGNLTVNNWAPALFYWYTQPPTLTIVIETNGQRSSNVSFVAENTQQSSKAIEIWKDKNGIITVSKFRQTSPVFMKAIIVEEAGQRKWEATITFDDDGNASILDSKAKKPTCGRNNCTIEIDTNDHFTLFPDNALAPTSIPEAIVSNVIVVLVKNDRHPQNGVEITVKRVGSEEVIAMATTNSSGLAHLADVTDRTIIVEAVEQVEDGIRRYVEIHTVESLPHRIVLDIGEHFSSPVAKLSTPTPAPTDEIAINQPTLQYGQTLLSDDRKVKAILEIDWFLDELPEQELQEMQAEILQAEASASDRTLEDIFGDVGVNLEVRWDQQLPKNVAGDDGKFDVDELLAIAKDYRSLEIDQDTWHFYLVFGGEFAEFPAQSIMFGHDRDAAAVFTRGRSPATGELKFEVAHEMGHMLNLPHPWQAYGDTRSVMTYPSRWDDWNWTDPTIYRFDEFGQQHIQRAPEQYVRPGESSFLDYGGQTPWRESR